MSQNTYEAIRTKQMIEHRAKQEAEERARAAARPWR
jgi:hypothetical protein